MRRKAESLSGKMQNCKSNMGRAQSIFAKITRINRKEEGFTLMEILLAVTILAVGIAAALGAYSEIIANSSAAGDYTIAAVLAKSKALLIGERLEPASSGTFESPFQRFRWIVDEGTLIVEFPGPHGSKREYSVPIPSREL